MKTRNASLFVLVMPILISCDCRQVVSGTVVDKLTHAPIMGVIANKKGENWDKSTTDDIGYFKLASISGGINCPPMTVVFKAQDYKTVEVDILADGQQKIEMESVNKGTE